MSYFDDFDIVMDEDGTGYMLMQPNPGPPVGGRAAVGVAVAMGATAATLATWSRLAYKNWNPGRVADRDAQWKFAALTMIVGCAGAAVSSRPGTRVPTTIGTALGVAVGQIPALWDPGIVGRHPILGNIWQYSLPVAGALLGANVVNP